MQTLLPKESDSKPFWKEYITFYQSYRPCTPNSGTIIFAEKEFVMIFQSDVFLTWCHSQQVNLSRVSQLFWLFLQFTFGGHRSCKAENSTVNFCDMNISEKADISASIQHDGQNVKNQKYYLHFIWRKTREMFLSK